MSRQRPDCPDEDTDSRWVCRMLEWVTYQEWYSSSCCGWSSLSEDPCHNFSHGPNSGVYGQGNCSSKEGYYFTTSMYIHQDNYSVDRQETEWRECRRTTWQEWVCSKLSGIKISLRKYSKRSDGAFRQWLGIRRDWCGSVQLPSHCRLMNSFQGSLSPKNSVKHDMAIKNTVKHDLEVGWETRSHTHKPGSEGDFFGNVFFT